MTTKWNGPVPKVEYEQMAEHIQKLKYEVARLESENRDLQEESHYWQTTSSKVCAAWDRQAKQNSKEADLLKREMDVVRMEQAFKVGQLENTIRLREEECKSLYERAEKAASHERDKARGAWQDPWAESIARKVFYEELRKVAHGLIGDGSGDVFLVGLKMSNAAEKSLKEGVTP